MIHTHNKARASFLLLLLFPSSSSFIHLLDRTALEEHGGDGDGSEGATSALKVGGTGGDDAGRGGLGREAGGADRLGGGGDRGLGGRGRGGDGGREGLGLVGGGGRGRGRRGGLGGRRRRGVRLVRRRGGRDGADGGADGHDDGGHAGAGRRARRLLRGAADDGLDRGRVDGAGGPLAGAVSKGLGGVGRGERTARADGAGAAGNEGAAGKDGSTGNKGAGSGGLLGEAIDIIVNLVGHGEGGQAHQGEKSELHGEYYASRFLLVGIFFEGVECWATSPSFLGSE